MTAFDILALRHAGPAALGVTLDALDTVNRIASHVDAARLDWRVLTVGGPSVALRHGLTLPAHAIVGTRPRDVVVVLGIGAAGPEEIERRLAEPDARAAAAWLRGASRRGATLAAACTGVFLLGDAGALDNRRCTTTWWLSGLLARRCPAARVDADAIVLEDDGVLDRRCDDLAARLDDGTDRAFLRSRLGARSPAAFGCAAACIASALHCRRIARERRSRARRLRVLCVRATEEHNRARRRSASASHIDSNTVAPHPRRHRTVTQQADPEDPSGRRA